MLCISAFIKSLLNKNPWLYLEHSSTSKECNAKIRITSSEINIFLELAWTSFNVN
jgi:hypothetical protein